MDQKYGSEIWIKNMDQNMAELKKHLWATKNHLPHSKVWIKSNMEIWIKYGSKYGSTEKAEQQQWATKNHLTHNKGPKNMDQKYGSKLWIKIWIKNMDKK